MQLKEIDADKNIIVDLEPTDISIIIQEVRGSLVEAIGLGLRSWQSRWRREPRVRTVLSTCLLGRMAQLELTDSNRSLPTDPLHTLNSIGFRNYTETQVRALGSQAAEILELSSAFQELQSAVPEDFVL